jgi:type I restriction enzyme M protein
MDNHSNALASKVWGFCTVLMTDGVSYGDYLEQITYLLFLKMIDEYSKPPHNKKFEIPAVYTWSSLTSKTGAELEKHYVKLLEALSNQKGVLGQIYTKSQNKIQDPAKLSRLIDLINKEQWLRLDADVKGEIYEYLLQKNAEDTKSGAGQYFTPRPLIQAMVECLYPEPEKTICDPACGTGGFFLTAYNFISKIEGLDADQKKFLKHITFKGNEIVANTRRLCLMNMFLHNMCDIDSEDVISPKDSLASDPGTRYDYVLTNPPFGKKSGFTITNDEGKQEKQDLAYNRQDFWATTSNKQLNFVQHIHTILKSSGKAAVVVPDNVLFEGGAGETVRKKLLETTDLHTILRLPTGIFYAQGVKANVIFFDNKPAAKEAWTKEIWIYDFRTNQHFTLKKDTLTLDALNDFIACYNPDNRFARKETYNAETNPDGLWRKFTYEEIIARDKTNLDIFWVKDKSLTDLDNLPEPDVLMTEIIENLESALQNIKTMVETL